MADVFETNQPVLFTGDVGGVRIAPGYPVVPPCPPPDINVEDWLDSIEKLEKSPAQTLFLTHYGQVNDKTPHLDGLKKILLEWADWMRPYAEKDVPAAEIVPLFEAFVAQQLTAAGVAPEDLEVYNKANPAFMSVAGLLRYWKKKRPAAAPVPPPYTPDHILDRLANRHILIVGDVMIDRYLTGHVSRISPEAPVPVVLFQNSEDRLGGAANVALNIQALGSVPLLCSVTGTDADGDALQRLLPELGMSNAGLAQSGERVTTVKTRILGNHQQMLRIDKEDTHDLSAAEVKLLLEKIRTLLDRHNVGAIILQDYNKGVLSAEMISEVLAESKKRGIPVAVDPKKRNFFSYTGVSLFKPNLKEIRDSVPFHVAPELSSLQQASDWLREQLHHEWTMITLSEKGLFIEEGAKETGAIYPTTARNIADVSGAGDTVISIAALGLAAGLSSKDIAVLSNLAGGQVCEVPGVVPVNKKLLAEEWVSLGG